jgi:hypothetical protein
MKQLVITGAVAGALLVSNAASAQVQFLPIRGSAAIFGSYMSQSDNQYPLNPDGFGGGAQLGFNITRNFFITGSYEYDYLRQDNASSGALGLNPPGGSTTYGLDTEQVRAGGGWKFPLRPAPIDLFAKVEYVHYGYRYVNGIQDGQAIANGSPFNEDGVGGHFGFQTRMPGFSLYGSAGYLSLSNADGPEFNIGAEVPMLPFVWAFAEYRYDDLRYDNGGCCYYNSERNEIDNVHLGVRMSF